MPDKTPCRRCGRVGFVRTETVIKGARSLRSFYCGSCNSTWEVAEDGETKDKPHAGRQDDPDLSGTPHR
jgi:hypothetical protein